MKQVFVIRHAPKSKDGQLSSEGRDLAAKLKHSLGTFAIIISSPMQRTQDTTKLLTDQSFTTDERASIPDFTPEEEHELFDLGQKHTAGIAGVIFDTPRFRDRAEKRGRTLAELIKELLDQLPEDGKALIVSHDGTMVAAEKILKNEPLTKAERNYQPLSGFIVDEESHLTYFSL